MSAPSHAYVEVEAESEEDAIDSAMDALTINEISEWEPMRQFNEGNVCHCPRPWEATAEVIEEDE